MANMPNHPIYLRRYLRLLNARGNTGFTNLVLDVAAGSQQGQAARPQGTKARSRSISSGELPSSSAAISDALYPRSIFAVDLPSQ